MKYTLALVLVLSLIGCATAGRMTDVRLGMTKDEVIDAIGKPASISAQGQTEYLNYALSETSDQAFYGVTRPYFVRLVNGRVESYGRMGDFDSTNTPTVRLESNESIKHGVTDDMYTELKRLKELKDSGAITDAEFQEQKKRILEKY